MKTETRLYDDGTEPDVIRRFCCDGLCRQGRDCPGAPAPAEACTDLGSEDTVDDAKSLGTAILLGLVVATIAAISFLAGYFA